MKEVKSIDENIGYIKASSDPLSADVGIVRGKRFTWIFDVGADDEVCDYINGIEGPKAVVISHFHQDHMTNLSRIKYDELYVGDFTFTKTKSGTVVKDELVIDDGIKVHLKAIPSSHAKGSLIMEINEEYVFLGDSVYCTSKNGTAVYNATLLNMEIRALKEIKAELFLLSHANIFVKRKETLIRGLEYIYNRRKNNDPYITVE